MIYTWVIFITESLKTGHIVLRSEDDMPSFQRLLAMVINFHLQLKCESGLHFKKF